MLEQKKSNSWTPVGPTKDRSSSPNQLCLQFKAGAIITTEARPGQRAIKEGSKVVNRDWVNHQACSLSQNIHVVSHFLWRIIIFSKLIRKIIPTKKKKKFVH